MNRTGSWLSALLLIAAALIASARPDAFVLTRVGLVDGELWRLWTGHLVHHTPAHFVFDVGVAVLLLGFVPRALPWLFLAPFVGIAALVLRPELVSYAGLSGVLHGVMVLACLRLRRSGDGMGRCLASAALVAVMAKAAYEVSTGAAAFTADIEMGGATVFEAHFVGALLGLLLGVCQAAARRRASRGTCALAVTSPIRRLSRCCGGNWD